MVNGGEMALCFVVMFVSSHISYKKKVLDIMSMSYS